MELYSVLMSVYAKENSVYFSEAIESMLMQTVPPSEFVLVCDGSLTPELDSVIEKVCAKQPSIFRVIRIEENRGLANALRIGLEQCSCDIVARMDSDDIAVPERMERQLAFLYEHPNISVVGGQISEFEHNPDQPTGIRKVPLSPHDVRKRIGSRCPMNHMTVTFRRDDVFAAGNYKDFDKLEDYYLWSRMLLSGFSLSNLDFVCVKVRVGNGMYIRRGGWKYFRSIAKFEKFLYKSGLVSPIRYISNMCVRFCGTILISASMRKHLYNRLLRN